MGTIEVFEMHPDVEWFVGTCTHVDDDPTAMTRGEIDIREIDLAHRSSSVRDGHESVRMRKEIRG